MSGMRDEKALRSRLNWPPDLISCTHKLIVSLKWTVWWLAAGYNVHQDMTGDHPRQQVNLGVKCKPFYRVCRV